MDEGRTGDREIDKEVILKIKSLVRAWTDTMARTWVSPSTVGKSQEIAKLGGKMVVLIIDILSLKKTNNQVVSWYNETRLMKF